MGHLIVMVARPTIIQHAMPFDVTMVSLHIFLEGNFCFGDNCLKLIRLKLLRIKHAPLS